MKCVMIPRNGSMFPREIGMLKPHGIDHAFMVLC